MSAARTTFPAATAERQTPQVKPVNGQPRPIAYPTRSGVDVLCKQRANVDNDRWQQQVEALVKAAAAEGRRQGERAGYTQGWHWGLVCGICTGGIAVGALWIGWPQLQAALAWAGVA